MLVFYLKKFPFLDVKKLREVLFYIELKGNTSRKFLRTLEYRKETSYFMYRYRFSMMSEITMYI